MTRQYKRKRMVGMENDNNHNRKSLNASERQRGKSEAVSGLRDWNLGRDKELIDTLRWNMEIDLADECYRKELTDPTKLITEILQKLGIGRFNLHKYTCPLPERLSDEEVLSRSGL